MMAVSAYFVMDLDRPRQSIITNDAPPPENARAKKNV